MKKIATDLAPAAIGPYSQGVVVDGNQKIIYVSGQLPVDPKTGQFVEGDIQALTTRVIDNIEAILIAAGSRLDKVIRTDVFLLDLKEFSKVNEIYAKRFKGDPLPVRQTIQVAGLPMNSPIEISCIAIG